MTSGTSMVHFEGFSRTLKEQLGKIKYLGMFTYPIAIMSPFENWRFPKAKSENFELCNRIASQK